MRRRRITQVGQWITIQSIRAALQKNDVGSMRLDVRFDACRCGEKLAIACARGKRNVASCADGLVLASLVRVPSARIQDAATFMNVGEDQRRIDFMRIENGVAMMDPPYFARKVSITTARVLKTQNPAELVRCAWCRPPIS